MKVYVLVNYTGYEGETENIGVFSTLESAKKMAIEKTNPCTLQEGVAKLLGLDIYDLVEMEDNDYAKLIDSYYETIYEVICKWDWEIEEHILMY